MKKIRIGIGIADAGETEGGLDGLLQQFRDAEATGFDTAWIPNIFSFDALTLSALAGRETERIEIGTAVVPTHSRHPFYLAQQAVSTQAASGGRFVCGLGPSHKVVIENMLGLSYDKPARHVREYVTIVKQLVETGHCKFEGKTYRVNASLKATGGSPMPVLIGALGPLMRKIAGTLCDGTITWMTGPRTLADVIVPDLVSHAERAGRSAPRIVAGLPVCVTDDPAGAREAAGKAFAMYGSLPSYRAMLDHEGVQSPGEIAVAGDEGAVEEYVEGLASAGVTDLHAFVFPFGPDRQAATARTQTLLADLARR